MTGKYYLQSGAFVTINEGQSIHVKLASGEAMDFKGNKVGEGLKNITWHVSGEEEGRVGKIMKAGCKEQLCDGGLLEAT